MEQIHRAHELGERHGGESLSSRSSEGGPRGGAVGGPGCCGALLQRYWASLTPGFDRARGAYVETGGIIMPVVSWP